MRVTIRDIAEAVGVHHTTVSRALNPQTASLISTDTVERVRRTALALGYTPNMVARGLKRNRTGTVGVMVPDLATSVMAAIVRGIDDVMIPAGYVPLVVSTDDSSERERTLIDTLSSRGVEGLVVTTARLSNPRLDKLIDQGFPLVLAHRRAAGSAVPNVTGDDEHGIRAAVDHLVRLGHRRIAHITGVDDTSTAAVRSTAFRQALLSHGIRVDETLIRSAHSYRYAEGERVFTELHTSGAQFTAVLAGNDQLAIGCLDAMRRRGLRCPEDVSIVGFNDMQLVDKLRPALTTVHVPHQIIGSESAKLLLEQIETSQTVHRTVQIPVSLVVRESCGPPPAGPT